ncbi:MAG: hypothetical protein QW083_04395 [Methanomassiliicoccales archaeon]
MLKEQEVAAYAGRLLEYEYHVGKRVTREDAFREAGIPLSYLDDVVKYLDRKETVNVNALTDQEFDEYERLSRLVILAAYRNPNIGRYGMRLCDVYMHLPEKNIQKAKKIMAYIESVNNMDFSSARADERAERFLKAALNLPEDQRSALGLMENLGLGIYNARKLVAIMRSLRSETYKAPAVKVKEFPEEPHLVDIERKEKQKSLETKSEVAYKPPTREEYEIHRRPGKQQKETETEELEDLRGRRCLFHGNVAASRCLSCGTLLCTDCLSKSNYCPRCGSPISKKSSKIEEPREPGKPSDSTSAAKGSSEEDKSSRDWSRL